MTVLGRKPWALMLPHSAPSVAISTGSGFDLKRRDAELVEMAFPGRLISKPSVGMLEQAGDHGTGQCSLAHVSDRLIIDRVIAVAGAQQFEEVEAVLGVRRAKPGEVLVADLGAE